MPKHALVTLQIGPSDLFELVNPNFEEACRKHDWSFEIINERKIGFIPIRRKVRRIQFEKFQIGALLEKYDRILYLDSDILINPSLPNVFDIVPEEAFGCVMEDVGPLKWKREEERKKAQRRLGKLPNWTSGYFNSGMFVVSKIHKPIFSTKWRDVTGGRWADQTTLNYQVRAHGFQIHELPIEFNYLAELCPEWDDPQKRKKAHIVHYAGPEAKAAMVEDLEKLQENRTQKSSASL
jgi:lipopolysaccharide biosynthesis glycosyltransferase